MKNIVIIGCGSTGEHVYRFISKYNLFNVIGFAVDKEYIVDGKFLNKPIFALDDLSQIINKQEDYIFVAILWNRLNADRKNLYLRLKKEGYKFANLISPTAVIDGEIGENCWFHDYSSVWFDSKVGNCVFVRSYGFIAEKCEVQDYCYIGVRATIAGKCTVGEQTFLGIHSAIFDTRSVGKKCIIGACCGVKRNLPDFSVCKLSSESVVVKSYPTDIIETKLEFKKTVR